MGKKNTHELENMLGSTHFKDFDAFRSENKESFIDENDSFCCYFKELFRKKGLTQQRVFLKADIPERYGYKILSGEKHTKQRDVILRICYAGEFSLEETQRALEQYQMPQLYAKIPRDAFLMIIFNKRPGSIIEVNELMIANNFEPLRTSGYQD